MKLLTQEVAFLEHAENNPRNSEGSFVTLKDGRILFAYSRFLGESGDDDGAAVIMGLVSSDEGRTWQALPEPLVQRDGGMNVMSVSFLRLQDGRVAIFYLIKNSLIDCCLWMRASDDECSTWGAPVCCTPGFGYHVVNNDRVIQLRGGGLLVPATLHRTFRNTGGQPASLDMQGLNTFFRSDDGGVNWQNAGAWWAVPCGVSQEVGIVELRDGALFSWCRTDQGCQWGARSTDGAVTWSIPEATGFCSPVAPMSMKRDPATDCLLAIWNDHDPRWGRALGIAPQEMGKGSWKRTPLAISISRDEGKTWEPSRLLEDTTEREFCYIAIHFIADTVLLAYCCGKRPGILCDTKIVRLPYSQLYAER